jgi:uncharacterized protein (TIGR02001 family)
VVGSHLLKPSALHTLLAALLLALASAAGHATDLASDLTFGGNLALTTDYIYRGVSESDGHGAVQADVHADLDGTFLGTWASSRDRTLYPYARADLDVYFGHRFDFGGIWSASLSAHARYFVGGTQPTSDDYQEITASVTYLDSWTLSLTAIPNAVRYWYDVRLGRSPAWVAETSAQWPIVGGLFVTGGAGYYYSNAPSPPAPQAPSYDAYPPPGPPVPAQSATGYAYGNAGLAFEQGRWRLDVGYYLAQSKAQQLFPYRSANDHFAGSVAWRF